MRRVPPWSAVIVGLVSLPLVLFFSLFKGLLKKFYPAILGLFQPMTKKGEPERFRDYYWRSLPMDNSAGDVLLGTGFTELFVPLQHTERAMNVLNEWYKEKGVAATGYYSTELYAGHTSARWLSPAYESGEYADGTVRFDFFWYKNNEGMPNGKEDFFTQFWELFRERGIPFRLHWGKYIHNYRHAEWAAYYREQLPKWDDLLRLREQRDPDNVFLTDYWKLHLMGKT